MTGWNYADVWEEIARTVPDRAALIQGGRVVSWGAFDSRADALGRRLIEAGLTGESKIAAFLYNSPEYLETYYAAFKIGATPVNTNYRYVAHELVYLFDNADAETVVFHASFAAVVEAIRGELPKVKLWIAVAQPGHPAPPCAEDYEAIVSRPGPRALPSWGRSSD